MLKFLVTKLTVWGLQFFCDELYFVIKDDFKQDELQYFHYGPYKRVRLIVYVKIEDKEDYGKNQSCSSAKYKHNQSLGK